MDGRSVQSSQREWAERRGIAVDARGYVLDYASNLRAPLSAAALAAFERGSGSELKDHARRPAKMRALHSSAALAVNVFDFWTERNHDRVVRALGSAGRANGFSFEAKLPTGAGGSANVDLLIHLVPDGIVGVESKFTEWMTPNAGRATSLRPYLSGTSSYWSRAGMPVAHQLASDIAAGVEVFHHLDVPQLLKHALGLARATGDAGAWQLRYVYLDVPCPVKDDHARELARFELLVDTELRFRSLTYQDFVAALGPAATAEETTYFDYLRDRYVGGVAA